MEAEADVPPVVGLVTSNSNVAEELASSDRRPKCLLSASNSSSSSAKSSSSSASSLSQDTPGEASLMASLLQKACDADGDRGAPLDPQRLLAVLPCALLGRRRRRCECDGRPLPLQLLLRPSPTLPAAVWGDRAPVEAS